MTKTSAPQPPCYIGVHKIPDDKNMNAALDYAARGWPVFGLTYKKNGDGKWKPHPNTSKGINGTRWGATTDAKVVCTRWSIDNPPQLGITCGIGSGLLVIDVDTAEGHGTDGVASLAALEAKHGRLPATLAAITPSGGRHLYFNYPSDRRIGNGTSIIAPGLDHRGEGGYIVAPPTKRPDGAYRWESDPSKTEIQDCPVWMLNKMAPKGLNNSSAVNENASHTLSNQIIDDWPSGSAQLWVEAALRDETTNLWAAPEGQRNHALNTAAFSLGQIIAGGYLERELVEQELAKEAYQIGLSNNEIWPTIRSGIEAGLKKPRHPKRFEAKTAPFKTPDCFVAWSVTDPASIPQTNFLYGDFIAAGYTSLTVAAPKVGKSMLSIAEAVDAATGGPILLETITPKKKVLYYCAEDDQHTINARVVAICKQHNIDQAELEGHLFAVSGINRDDFFLASGEDAKINESLFEWLQNFVTENGIEIVILDPLQDLTTCPETNEVFRRVGQRLRAFANLTGCGVHLVHHTRKMMAGSTPTIDDARGGGALRGTSRFNRILVPMTESQGEEAGVEEHWRYFRVGDAESNLAPPTSNSKQWFKKASIEIAEGHFQPAIHRWSWPGPLTGLPPDSIRIVRILAQEAERSGRPLR